MSILGLILYLLFLLILTCVVFFVVSIAMLNSFSIAKMVLKQEIELFFSRKKKKEKIMFAYEFMNATFQSFLADITATKDDEISKDFQLSLPEAKQLKKYALSVVQDKDLEFITQEEVTEFMKQSKAFHFLNSYTNSIKIFSTPEFLSVYEFSESLKNQDIRQMSESEITDFVSKFFNGTKVNQRSIRIMEMTLKKMELNKKTQKTTITSVEDNYLQTFFSGIFNTSVMKSFVVKLAIE